MKNIKRNFCEYFGDKPPISIARIDVEKWCIRGSEATRVSIIDGKSAALSIKPAILKIEQSNTVFIKRRIGSVNESINDRNMKIKLRCDSANS